MNSNLQSRAARKDLALLVESEGLGQQLFATAERLASGQRRREAWSALHELERQTRTGVLQFLHARELHVSYRDQLGRGVGLPGGAGLPVLPWAMQMRFVAGGTRRYLPVFRRLATRFAGSDSSDFFDYVVAHELAIVEFTRRELDHRDDSLQPVRELLGRVPGG